MFKIDKKSQNISINKIYKREFGEIHTPYSLIESMFSLFPEKIFKNPNIKWLDPGAGRGFFSIFLFNKLYKSLFDIIKDPIKRKEHILTKMLYMVEINPENISVLKSTFSEKANIIECDYIEHTFDCLFDVIIGNPPYNSNGLIKVPTNNIYSKKSDGKSIWYSFVKRSINLLKDDGMLSFIIPSIWMKPCRNDMYDYMMQYNIKKVHCFTNTQTNVIFNKEAQTPTCYFVLKKRENPGFIELYDNIHNKYIDFKLYDQCPIPLFYCSIIKKLLFYVETYGSLKKYVKKTNMPSKKAKISLSNENYPFKNIKTTKLSNKITPFLVIQYSDIPLAFYGEPKLVLGHKMYGFPYMDKDGEYGISNRDNYVIKDKTIEELYVLKDFLSTKMVMTLYDSTRYRMKYLEKYIFELLPDITNIPYFKNKKITDNVLFDFFNLTNEEINCIDTRFKINYNTL